MFKLSIRIFTFASLALIIQGCSSKPSSLYYWGQYEPMVYDIYLNPGKADVETQILTLSELIERAQSYNMKVPPGVYAHLGMAHAQSGNADAALNAFNTEKSLYPESTVFLDGIIERSNLKANLAARRSAESAEPNETASNKPATNTQKTLSDLTSNPVKDNAERIKQP